MKVIYRSFVEQQSRVYLRGSDFLITWFCPQGTRVDQRGGPAINLACRFLPKLFSITKESNDIDGWPLSFSPSSDFLSWGSAIKLGHFEYSSALLRVQRTFNISISIDCYCRICDRLFTVQFTIHLFLCSAPLTRVTSLAYKVSSVMTKCPYSWITCSLAHQCILVTHTCMRRGNLALACFG